jgi:hypothetical protein
VLQTWRLIHIAAGVVALAIFWIPLVARKGGRLHRRAGLVYAWAMLVVVVAAFGTVGWRLEYEDLPSVRVRSVFLAYVGLLAFASGWFGLRALRTKKRTGPSWNPIDIGPSVALALGGLALIGWWLRTDVSVLVIVFGVLGLWLGVQHLRTWLTAPNDAHHWWYQHMSGMIAACIGTVTAFLVVNSSRLVPDSFNLVLWIAPGVVGGVGISVWTAYYRKKFARPERGADASATSGVVSGAPGAER